MFIPTFITLATVIDPFFFFSASAEEKVRSKRSIPDEAQADDGDSAQNDDANSQENTAEDTDGDSAEKPADSQEGDNDTAENDNDDDSKEADTASDETAEDEETDEDDLTIVSWHGSMNGTHKHFGHCRNSKSPKICGHVDTSTTFWDWTPSHQSKASHHLLSIVTVSEVCSNFL